MSSELAPPGWAKATAPEPRTALFRNDRPLSISGRERRFQADSGEQSANNAFASAAMQAAYRHGGPWLDAVRDYVAGNCAAVRRCLEGVPGVSLIDPEGTFLLWLDFRGLRLEPAALTSFLRERAGWAVTRGPAFGDEGIGFARLNIACPRSKLIAALGQLERAVASDI